MKNNNDLDKIYSAITSIECPEELDIPDTLLLDEYCYFPYEDPIVNGPGYPDLKPDPDKKDYINEYLTFEILTDGELHGGETVSVYNVIKYSTDSGKTGNNLPPILKVKKGQKIGVKGEFSTYEGSGGFEGSTCKFNLRGNIMSLTHGDDFKGVTSFKYGMSVFQNLFRNTNVIDASKLILPVKYVDLDNKQAYYSMFYGCTLLTKSPRIMTEMYETADKAGKYFESMFCNCSSLREIYGMLCKDSHGSSSAPNSNISANFSYGVPTDGGVFYKNINAMWNDNQGYGTYGIPGTKGDGTVIKTDPSDLKID